MATSREIGDRIKELRLAKGMTQSELAEMSGVRVSAIVNYEKGRRIPRDDTKSKLAEALGERVGQIFFMEGGEYSDSNRPQIIP